MILWILVYWYYRKTSTEEEKPQQTLNTVDQVKKPTEERMQDIVEVRNKVDKIIEINKL